MTKQVMHEFHFLMERSMKDELLELDLFEKKTGLSGVIVRILELLFPVIKNEHTWGEQRESRYRYISEDPDEIRDHVHVYFPDTLYRELKLMHADLNCFSIAQLLRELLEWFLTLVKEIGDDVINKLRKVINSWKKTFEKDRLTFGVFLRQLRIIYKHLRGKNRQIHIYDSNFSPFWIFNL